jgi:hypothetical protein
MTDRLPVLPDGHEGRPIVWGPWRPTEVNTIAACGRLRLRSAACEACGAETVLHASGRSGRDTRAYAHHCTSCGHTRAAWRSDFIPGRWTARLVPIETTKEPK